MSHECPITGSTQSDPAQNTWFSKVLSNSDGTWREIWCAMNPVLRPADALGASQGGEEVLLEPFLNPQAIR